MMDHLPQDASSTSGYPSVVLAGETANVVVLIDARHLVRDCIGYRLSCEGYKVEPIAGLVDLDTISQYSRPSVIMYYSEESAHELELSIASLIDSFGSTPLIIMAPEDDLAIVISVIRQGVRGYLPNNSTINDVIGAIRLVEAGGTYVPASSILSSKTIKTSSAGAFAGKFTAKQSAIIERIRRGQPNKVIAYELCMCESTVKVHIRNVMRKMNVKNRTELAYRMADGSA